MTLSTALLAVTKEWTSRRTVVAGVSGRISDDTLSGCGCGPRKPRSAIGDRPWSGANIGGMSKCR